MNKAIPEGNTAIPQGNTAVPQGNTAMPQGNTAIPQIQNDNTVLLDSTIDFCKATLSDLKKQIDEISKMVFDFRDVDRVADKKRPLEIEYQRRIAICMELNEFVVEPTGQKTIALAVSTMNEYVRQAGTTNKFFNFLPSVIPGTFHGRDFDSVLARVSSHFQTAMIGLESTDDSNKLYQNTLDKLRANLASVAGKNLSAVSRRRHEVSQWAVFLSTLNEYGAKAFASKHPSS